jgi:hypothetical protein
MMKVSTLKIAKLIAEHREREQLNHQQELTKGQIAEVLLRLRDVLSSAAFEHYSLGELIDWLFESEV